MAQTRRGLLASLGSVGAVALAGCAGGDTGNGQDTTTTTTAATTTTETANDGTTTTDDETTTTDDGMGAGASVAVRAHDEYGDVLVDGDGMTVYMFDSDSQGSGTSTCSGSCAENWPPLTGDAADAGDGVTASLSTFERDDGSMQVAANGWPLYYFASDESPGDANGQGVGDVWWVLDPAGEPTRGAGDGETTTTTAEDDGGAYAYD